MARYTIVNFQNSGNNLSLNDGQLRNLLRHITFDCLAAEDFYRANKFVSTLESLEEGTLGCLLIWREFSNTIIDGDTPDFNKYLVHLTRKEMDAYKSHLLSEGVAV